MSAVDSVLVACQRHDFNYARACVASVRRWYPDIPISLIKDAMYGAFDTREMERAWGVGVVETGGGRFGWGFSKLEALFLPPGRRVMVLDADTVFVGPVLSSLAGVGEDFVVQREEPTPEFVEEQAFSLSGLAGVDPGFSFPGYTFNTGQFVARTGLLRRSDFEGLVAWEEPRRVLHPDVFRMGEQGLLNYVIQKTVASGRASIRRVRLMETPDSAAAGAIRLEQLGPESPHRFLLHWCGLKGKTFRQSPRGDLLVHFERAYYGRVPLGGARRAAAAMGRFLEREGRGFARRLLGKDRGKSG